MTKHLTEFKRFHYWLDKIAEKRDNMDKNEYNRTFQDNGIRTTKKGRLVEWLLKTHPNWKKWRLQKLRYKRLYLLKHINPLPDQKNAPQVNF